ncbi:AMP-binding protein [Patescibacteria group bacterium AH-259-L07]|nr:AMP-binding protein [Patescibacteria group bacterium AH-259-L07]
MILTKILEKNAKEFANRSALTMRMGYRTVSLTYKDVYDLSLGVACLLQRKGVKKGDKVLLLAPNSPYWVCIYWGSLINGCVLVPLNIQSTSEMIERIAAQTKAKIIFKHLFFKEAVPEYLKSYDIELIREEAAEIDCSNFDKVSAKENDLMEIMYTSGTTGEPKGVMLTHKNIYSNLEALSRTIRISQDNRFLSILPLSHIFEQTIGFLLPFYYGAHIIYAHSPAAVGDLLKEYRITHMAAVPEFLSVVMNKIEAKAREEAKLKKFDKLMSLSLKIGVKSVQRLIFNSVHKKFGSKLNTVASGGAPLDPELERKWNALGIYLLQGYGLSESSPVISTNTYENHRLGSVGKVLPDVKVKIASDGEIFVKGPNVFGGYFKNKQRTKQAFTADGWFKTDDIGELDQDGFLFIKGRKKYMILGPGGQNVYPEDIEFELNKMPAVKDSCVLGLEKEGSQLEIHAALLLDSEIVKKKRSIQLQEIIGKVNKKLTSYQQISSWSVWPDDDFPRSATKKVKKEEVIKWLKSKQRPQLAKALENKQKTLLMYILAEITKTPITRIKSSTNIVQDLSLDSLLRIELVARIEEKFGVIIEEVKIGPSTTVSDLQKTIQKTKPVEKIPLKKWPRHWTISWLRNALQPVFVFLLLKIFVKFKIEGQENLENLELPAIFMPNHLSYLDSVVVAISMPLSIRRKIAFAAAKDAVYDTYKYLIWLFELLFNIFPFPRQEKENIKLGLEYMGKLLDQNWSIIVYPEGKMSLTGRLGLLKRGAGLIAVEMDTYIVPIKMIGTNYILPPGKIIPRKTGVITVKFGKPIKFSRQDSYIQVTQKIQQIMQQL